MKAILNVTMILTNLFKYGPERLILNQHLTNPKISFFKINFAYDNKTEPKFC